MDKKLFDYYTGIKVTVYGSDYNNVEDARLKEIIIMSRKDVKAGRKAREKSEFKNDAEYRIYLGALINSAWEVKMGIEASLVDE